MVVGGGTVIYGQRKNGQGAEARQACSDPVSNDLFLKHPARPPQVAATAEDGVPKESDTSSCLRLQPFLLQPQELGEGIWSAEADRGLSPLTWARARAWAQARMGCHHPPAGEAVGQGDRKQEGEGQESVGPAQVAGKPGFWHFPVCTKEPKSLTALLTARSFGKPALYSQQHPAAHKLTKHQPTTHWAALQHTRLSAHNQGHTHAAHTHPSPQPGTRSAWRATCSAKGRVTVRDSSSSCRLFTAAVKPFCCPSPEPPESALCSPPQKHPWSPLQSASVCLWHFLWEGRGGAISAAPVLIPVPRALREEQLRNWARGACGVVATPGWVGAVCWGGSEQASSLSSPA